MNAERLKRKKISDSDILRYVKPELLLTTLSQKPKEAEWFIKKFSKTRMLEVLRETNLWSSFSNTIQTQLFNRVDYEKYVSVLYKKWSFQYVVYSNEQLLISKRFGMVPACRMPNSTMQCIRLSHGVENVTEFMYWPKDKQWKSKDGYIIALNHVASTFEEYLKNCQFNIFLLLFYQKPFPNVLIHLIRTFL
jgi:hypothetical protein